MNNYGGLMNKLVLLVFLVGGMFGSAMADDKLDAVKAKATKEANEFNKALMGNGGWKKSVVGAISASNAKYSASAQRKDKAPVEGIDGKDTTWTEWFKADKSAKAKKAKAPAMPALVSGVMNNPCSDALRAAKAKDKSVSEVFVMDRLGATVCAADPTSDYDQGDEDKWLEPFVNGTDPHVGDPKRDESSGNFQTQISISIQDGGQKIGVMTIGTSVK
jgi:hypothetical protein